MLALVADPPHYLFLPISLNSLDREGVRLLSPRDSQILPKPLAGADDTVQVTQPSSRRISMKILFIVWFRFSWSVVEPSWGRSGICVAFGVVFFYFSSVVGPWLYLDDVMLYSCIVWSGDCKPTMYLLFPYCITWVVVKITSLATLLSMRLCL